MTEAALGVDTNNPGGAFQLYTSLGFELQNYEAVYTKPIARADLSASAGDAELGEHAVPQRGQVGECQRQTDVGPVERRGGVRQHRRPAAGEQVDEHRAMRCTELAGVEALRQHAARTCGHRP